MKIVLHDCRRDSLEFLSDNITNFGYQTGIAKDAADIMAMLASNQYKVILTNGGYGETSAKQIRKHHPSVFIIAIRNRDSGEEYIYSDADTCLTRPYAMSQLLQAIGKQFRVAEQPGASVQD